MEDKIFDIVTDLLRQDISKNEAIDKLLDLHNDSLKIKNMNTDNTQLVIKDNGVLADVSGSFDLKKLKKLFGDLYLEGYYDRDWKIDQDSADKKAETLAVEKMLDKCRV